MINHQADIKPAVEIWSGVEARALREARRMSIREFAHHIGVSERMISKWEASGRSLQPRPVNQAALDTSLIRAEPDVKVRFEALRSKEKVGLGTSPGIADTSLVYHTSVVDTIMAVEGLGKVDMERRTLLRNALFLAGAATVPSRDWLLATMDELAEPRRHTHMSQVRAIRHVFSVFQQLDVRRGGGQARTQLIRYFVQSVVPLLRTADATSPHGRALFEAAAEQSYLIGWMAFDCGENALAQRYLIQSLRLAQEARSNELGAHILAALSEQSTLTGSAEQGIQLAKAGRAGLKRASAHHFACLADLWALQARAEACLGERRAALASIAASQKAAERIRADEEPEWARFIPGAYLYGEYAHALGDLGDASEAMRFAQLSATAAAEQRRSRREALAYATLARAALEQRDVERAAFAATKAVELGVTVESNRSAMAIVDIRQRLEEHRSSPYVVSYLNIADALMPQAASSCA